MLYEILTGRPPPEPDARTGALYGVIDPHGLPDDMKETAENVREYIREHAESVSLGCGAVF